MQELDQLVLVVMDFYFLHVVTINLLKYGQL